jgi:hypothetical protein
MLPGYASAPLAIVWGEKYRRRVASPWPRIAGASASVYNYFYFIYFILSGPSPQKKTRSLVYSLLSFGLWSSSISSREVLPLLPFIIHP